MGFHEQLEGRGLRSVRKRDPSISVVTPPTEEPVSIPEAKEHLRVTSQNDDQYISRLVTTARLRLEVDYRRTFVTTVYRWVADAFPLEEIVLPRPPLQTVDLIQFVDVEGITQTLDASQYTVDSFREPGQVVPAFNEEWPATQTHINVVTVTFTAGFGLAAAVPQGEKQAILLLAGHWFTHRESQIDPPVPAELKDGLESLIWSDRVLEFAK